MQFASMSQSGFRCANIKFESDGYCLFGSAIYVFSEVGATHIVIDGLVRILLEKDAKPSGKTYENSSDSYGLHANCGARICQARL